MNSRKSIGVKGRELIRANLNHFSYVMGSAPIRQGPYMSRAQTMSECGIVLAGYVVPGCVEDRTCKLWENYSAVAVATLENMFGLC